MESGSWAECRKPVVADREGRREAPGAAEEVVVVADAGAAPSLQGVFYSLLDGFLHGFLRSIDQHHDFVDDVYCDVDGGGDPPDTHPSVH